MSLGKPTLLTDKWGETSKARAVPDSYFAGGAWWLHPDPEPDSARYAIRLFPRLQSEAPELVARARLSAVADPRPIDYSTASWANRPPERDPWHGRLGGGLVPHLYQRQDAQYAIDCLNAGRGAYLGWAVGLGKTLGAAMVLAGWPSNFSLIVCPNSAKAQWGAMLSTYCPWLAVIVLGNTPKQRAAALAEARALGDAGRPYALIVHFEAVPLIEGANKRGWKPLGRWDLVVVDEAHQLKSRTAKRTAAIRRLSRCGTLMLSGSVMSGTPDELFVPLQILRPKRYRAKRRDWVDPYMEVIDTDYAQVVVGPKLEALPRLRAELGQVLVVRRAQDHLDIPEAHVVEHDVDLYPEQRRVYRELFDTMFAQLADGDTVETADGAPLLTALRRVTGGVPAAEPGGPAVSAKHDRAMEIIEGAADTQLLVFTWHKEPGAELQRRCVAAGVSCGLVNGDVKREDRDAVIAQFKAGGLRVLCATLSTLGVAANLQCAGAVVFLEESFASVDNEQGVGRAVRQGQTANVSVHYIRAADTVDGRVMLTALSKAELRLLCLGV